MNLVGSPAFGILGCCKAPWTDPVTDLPTSREAPFLSWRPPSVLGLPRIARSTDGNKRTALLATRAFLYLNGRELEPAQEDELATLVAVADGSLSEPALAGWLELNSRDRR